MSYLIVSTVVVIVAAIAVANGVAMRRLGKRDEGLIWIGGALLAGS